MPPSDDFWPVHPPSPPRREDMSLADIMRLAASAAASNGEQIYTTHERLQLLCPEAPHLFRLTPLSCWPETVHVVEAVSSRHLLRQPVSAA